MARSSERVRTGNTTVYIDVVQCFLGFEHLRDFFLELSRPVSEAKLLAVRLLFRTRGVDWIFFSQHVPLLQIHDLVYSEDLDANMSN